MTLIIIVAHAPLASAMTTVALHAFPEMGSTLRAVDVQATESPQDVAHRIRTLLAEGPALVLVDVLGATPANAAVLAIEGTASRLVCGVNVPMLWRVLCYRAEPLDALAERAVEGARQAVIRLAPSKRQHQVLRGAQDDPEQHHHQQ